MMSFFHTSANSSYTYDNTHCICSSTILFLILILIKSLYAVRNSETFSTSLLNIYSLATLTFDLVLGQETSVATPTPTTLDRFWSCVYIVVICF